MTKAIAEKVIKTLQLYGRGPKNLLLFHGEWPHGMDPSTVEEAYAVLKQEGGPLHSEKPLYPWFMSEQDVEILFPDGIDKPQREFALELTVAVLEYLRDNARCTIDPGTFNRITEQVLREGNRRLFEREMLPARLIFNDHEETEGSLVAVFRQLESAGLVDKGAVDNLLPALVSNPKPVIKAVADLVNGLSDNKDYLMGGGQIRGLALVIEGDPGGAIGLMGALIGALPPALRRILEDPSPENLEAARNDPEILETTNCGRPECPTHGHLNQG